MSKYGVSIYGADFYGPDTANLYSSQLVAKSTGYGKITLSWATPGSSWTRLRLVRNSYGFPTHGDDGTVLLDLNCGPDATGTVDIAVNIYTDTSVKPSKFYYYSLFVQRTVGLARFWTRSADALGLSVGDKGYRDYLLQRLPGIATTGGEVEGLPDGDTPAGRLLALFGFDLATTREYLDHLVRMRDADSLCGTLVPSLCNLVGLEYEPEIGLRQNRVLARNAGFLHQTKGTATGVTSMAAALTGYGAEIIPPVNLCLDTRMSSFEGTSLTPWIKTSGPGGSAVVSGTPEPADDTWMLEVPASAGTYQFDHVVVGMQDAQEWGIPVTAGTTYSASAYCSGSGTLQVNIKWWDKDGALLSTSSGTATAANAGDWTARTSKSAAAPTGAVWASVQMVAVITTGPMYVDAVQFEAAASPTTYEAARKIKVHLIAPRTNLVANGGFDSDVAHWTVANGTVAQDTATVYNSGQGSAKITPSGAASLTSDAITLPAVNTYTAAVQIHPTSTGSFHLEVDWYDAGAALISSSSTDHSCPGGAWTRVALTASAPAGSVTAKVKVVETGGAGGVTYLDDVLLEETSQVKPYFDSTTNPGDVYYDGTAGESVSHLYPNSVVMKARLLDWLPKFLPVGTPYAVLIP